MHPLKKEKKNNLTFFAHLNQPSTSYFKIHEKDKLRQYIRVTTCRDKY